MRCCKRKGRAGTSCITHLHRSHTYAKVCALLARHRNLVNKSAGLRFLSTASLVYWYLYVRYLVYALLTTRVFVHVALCTVIIHHDIYKPTYIFPRAGGGMCVCQHGILLISSRILSPRVSSGLLRILRKRQSHSLLLLVSDYPLS